MYLQFKLSHQYNVGIGDMSNTFVIYTTTMSYPIVRQVNSLRTGAQFQIPATFFIKLRETRGKLPHSGFRPCLMTYSMRRKITANLAITSYVGETEDKRVGIVMEFLSHKTDFP